MAALMSLGLFVFELKTAPYQQTTRQTEWRHANNSRIGARPRRQYVGQGDDAITISGVLFPEFTGGKPSLQALRDMADTGKSWPLVNGSGEFEGMWLIDSLSETSSEFLPDGTARRIEFSVSLKRNDDDDHELLGDIRISNNGEMLT